MTASELDALRFPIGPWQRPTEILPSDRKRYIAEIVSFPFRLRGMTQDLSVAVWDTPYRPDGWTLRQVVHHTADSHINAYVRFKLALTEDSPTVIRPYMEDRWAKLPDYTLPLEPALRILDAVHNKWVFLMQMMDEEDWQRSYMHPEYKSIFRLDEAASLYAWHCAHHFAHVGLVVGK